MALFTTYSAANKYTNTALLTYILESKKFFVFNTTSGEPVVVYYYSYTRRATKHYKYFGMNLTAARSCENDMVSKYTRYFKRGELGGESSILDGQYKTLKADIKMVHSGGHAYDVDINVNEEDSVISFTQVQDPSSLFTYITNDYDETAAIDGVGLLTEATGYNKITSDSLTKRWTQERSGLGAYITQYAQKSYKFTGLTETAAKAIAHSKVSEYIFVQDNSDESTAWSQVLGASISAVHEYGTVWSVDITVDESAFVYSSSGYSQDPASLFATMITHDYDEYSDGEMIWITNVSYDEDRARVVVQYEAGQEISSAMVRVYASPTLNGTYEYRPTSCDYGPQSTTGTVYFNKDQYNHYFKLYSNELNHWSNKEAIP